MAHQSDDLPVHIQRVVLFQLVSRTSHKFQLVDRYAQNLEDGLQEQRVVLCAVLEGLNGGFAGIKETVKLQL